METRKAYHRQPASCQHTWVFEIWSAWVGLVYVLAVWANIKKSWTKSERLLHRSPRWCSALTNWSSTSSWHIGSTRSLCTNSWTKAYKYYSRWSKKNSRIKKWMSKALDRGQMLKVSSDSLSWRSLSSIWKPSFRKIILKWKFPKIRRGKIVWRLPNE